MSELRALSVRQPWAWGICAGVKRTENRTWTTDRRGTIAIHASTSPQVVNRFHKESGCDSMHRKNFAFGAIIGLADIMDVTSYGRQHEDDPFAEGPYCWTMGNGRLLKEPIPLPGKLNLFKLSPAIQEQIRSAETIEVDLRLDPSSKSIADVMTGAPDPVASYVELVEEFWRTNNHKDAMALAGDRLIAIAPDEATGYMITAALRLPDPDAEICSGLLLRAVELAPDNSLAWFFLSEAYLKEEMTQKAIEAADQMITLSPEHPSGLEARGRAYYQANEFVLACADCDAVLKFNSDNLAVLGLRAESKIALGDYQGAKADIAKALILNPGNTLLIERQRQLVDES